jgi:hypothetical protein
MAWTYKYADGSTGSTPWRVGDDGRYITSDEGVVQYNTPGSTGFGGDAAMSIMGYGGGQPSGGGDLGAISGGPYQLPAPAPAQPSGGAAWGGTATGGGGGGNQYSGGMRDNSYGGGQQGQIGQSVGNVSAMGQNPYLAQMGQVMTDQMTQNFNRRVMPQIQSQMAASGGYGGSRQGVVEANAMNDLNSNIGNALTNLYGQGYGSSLNYDLGLRGNDLGYANLDANIAQNNFNNQLTGANFGLGMYDRLQQGNALGLGAGTGIQNTPLNYWSQFGNQYNAIGQGGSASSSTQPGNALTGALGGFQLGDRLGSFFGNPTIPRPNDPTNYNFTGQAYT